MWTRENDGTDIQQIFMEHQLCFEDVWKRTYVSDGKTGLQGKGLTWGWTSDWNPGLPDLDSPLDEGLPELV